MASGLKKIASLVEVASVRRLPKVICLLPKNTPMFLDFLYTEESLDRQLPIKVERFLNDKRIMVACILKANLPVLLKIISSNNNVVYGRYGIEPVFKAFLSPELKYKIA